MRQLIQLPNGFWVSKPRPVTMTLEEAREIRAESEEVVVLCGDCGEWTHKWVSCCGYGGSDEIDEAYELLSNEGEV